MASLGDIFAGVGAFSGGLSQGLQTGFALQQRQQVIELQKRQANLQSIGAFADVMKPGVDPQVRKLTLDNIMPELGMDPEQTKKMMDAANKMDEDKRAAFTDFLENNEDIASGMIPLDTLVENFLDDPMGTMKFIQDDIDKRSDQKLKQEQFGLDVHKQQHQEEQDVINQAQDEAQIGISQQNANTSRAQLGIAQKQEARLSQQAADENKQKGVTALMNASNIKDAGTRAVVYKQINDKLGLGLAPEEIDDMANRPESFEEYAQKIELGIKVQGAELDKTKTSFEQRRVELSERVAASAEIDRMIDNRQKGMDALTKAAAVKDNALRGAVVEKLNKDLDLKMTPEELATFKEAPADTLQDMKDKLDIEKKTLEIAAANDGFGKNKTESVAFLELRASGKDTPTMPKWVKDMSPEEARTAADAVNRSGKLIDLGGSLKTKSSYDKVTFRVTELSGATRSMDRLIDVIEKNPETAGLLGTASRISQRAVGAVTSLDPLLGGATAEIRRAMLDAEPGARVELSKMVFGKSVPISEVLETVLRIKVSRALSGGTRVLAEEYQQATEMVDISGFVGDQQAVLTRLREINQQLKDMKQDNLNLLGDMKPGQMTDEDANEETDFGNFMKELNGEDQDQEEE